MGIGGIKIWGVGEGGRWEFGQEDLKFQLMGIGQVNW